MVNIQNESWNILTKKQFLLCKPVHAIYYYNVTKHTKLRQNNVKILTKRSALPNTLIIIRIAVL